MQNPFSTSVLLSKSQISSKCISNKNIPPYRSLAIEPRTSGALPPSPLKTAPQGAKESQGATPPPDKEIQGAAASGDKEEEKPVDDWEEKDGGGEEDEEDTVGPAAAG